MAYFCTVHKDDVADVLGEKLDPCTSHMVFDSGYDLSAMLKAAEDQPQKVVVAMIKDASAKFGWSFDKALTASQ